MSDASIVLPRPTSSASSHRTGSRGARPFGDMELVREQPDAPPRNEPRPSASEAQEVQDAQAGDEILDLVEVAQDETLEERAFELQGPQRVGRRGAPVCELQRSIGETRDDPSFLLGWR